MRGDVAEAVGFARGVGILDADGVAAGCGDLQRVGVVERRHAGVLEERREVRSGPERVDPQVGTIPCAALYSSCFSRRRAVSSSAARIERVTTSA